MQHLPTRLLPWSSAVLHHRAGIYSHTSPRFCGHAVLEALVRACLLNSRRTVKPCLIFHAYLESEGHLPSSCSSTRGSGQGTAASPCFQGRARSGTLSFGGFQGVSHTASAEPISITSLHSRTDLKGSKCSPASGQETP